jgi:hypothetical protein
MVTFLSSSQRFKLNYRWCWKASRSGRWTEPSVWTVKRTILMCSN